MLLQVCTILAKCLPKSFQGWHSRGALQKAIKGNLPQNCPKLAPCRRLSSTKEQSLDARNHAWKMRGSALQ